MGWPRLTGSTVPLAVPCSEKVGMGQACKGSLGSSFGGREKQGLGGSLCQSRGSWTNQAHAASCYMLLRLKLQQGQANFLA